MKWTPKNSKTVKIAISIKASFLNILKKFHHTVKDFLHNLLRRITYQKIIFYGKMLFFVTPKPFLEINK